MSRIGRLPIPLPDGVVVQVTDGTVRVEGPKGELERPLPGEVTLAAAGGVVTLARRDDSRRRRPQHGLARKLVANMVEGVGRGFSRTLEITAWLPGRGARDGDLLHARLLPPDPLSAAPRREREGRPPGRVTSKGPTARCSARRPRRSAGCAAGAVQGQGDQVRGQRIRRKAARRRRTGLMGRRADARLAVSGARRVRRRVRGTNGRPRLSVFRSDRHIYVQVVTDESGRTLLSVSTQPPSCAASWAKPATVDAARQVAARARRCQEKGITEVVFDRNGFLYHGASRRVATAPARRPSSSEGHARMAQPGSSPRIVDDRGVEVKKRCLHQPRRQGGEGGRRFSFSALVVVGDATAGRASASQGQGGARGDPQGLEKAKKDPCSTCDADGTIPFEVLGRFGAGEVDAQAPPRTARA